MRLPTKETAIYEFYNEYQGTVVIPESVTYNEKTYSVTSVGDDAFYYCSSLTSVTIPNSVTSIGNSAFYNCSSLTCITIPNSVTSIGDEAFCWCDGLTNITIPNGVTSIGQSAFYGCGSLTSIVVKSGNSVYDSRDNCNALIETSTNTLIRGCKNTVIPNSVTSIGEHAFEGCIGLTSVTISNSVTSIGNSAFYNCSSLTCITIPNSVTSIGDYAFAFCIDLTSIVVESGNSVYDSRDNCNAIIETATNTIITGCKNTVIPNSVTSIGDYAFHSCSGLTSVTIPNSVTSIGEYAFYNCYGLTSVTIGNGVTSIGHSAFSLCSGLTSVTIGNGVTSIGKCAFYNCYGLTSVTIPKSVTSIGNSAFEYCDGLKTIIYKSETPATLGSGAFTFYSATLVVPNDAAVSSYKAANEWKEFSKIIPAPAMNVANISTFPGSELVIPVEMKNVEEITAIQFDLYLPDGITVATDEDEEPMVTLAADRKTSTHTITAAQQEDGAIRVIAYSSSNNPFNGNEGVAVNIATNVSDAMAIGEYKLTMKNIRLADTNGNEYITDEKSSKINVNIMFGDVNNDLTVSIGDVLATVNYILGVSTKEFNFAAADVNCDKVISVGDIVEIVKIILNPVATSDNGYNGKRRAVASNGDRMSIGDVTAEDGNVSIPVSLENATAYTAFQMDVELPEGATLASVTLGSRATGSHSIAWSNIGDNKARIVAYSMNNAAFTGNSGELVTLNVETAEDASGTVAVDNIRMATAEGVETAISGCGTIIDGNGTTNINAASADATVKINGNSIVIIGATNSSVAVYSAAGALVEKIDSYAGETIILDKGVYIVRVGSKAVKVKL